MPVFEDIDELREKVGTHLGCSDWIEITQDQINAFARATGDHQWIHVDPDRAAVGPFGTTIAHGYLSLSLVPRVSWEVYDLRGVTMSVNYGANKLRFPAPVPVGAKVRGSIDLLSVESVHAGFQITTRVTIEIEGGAKPACVVECIALAVP